VVNVSNDGNISEIHNFISDQETPKTNIIHPIRKAPYIKKDPTRVFFVVKLFKRDEIRRAGGEKPTIRTNRTLS